MISQEANSVKMAQIIIPYRGDPYDVLRLKLVGDLGQVLFLPYHLCDEEAIRKSIKHSNVVINLVGRDWETRNFTFDQVVSALYLRCYVKCLNLGLLLHSLYTKQ